MGFKIFSPRPHDPILPEATEITERVQILPEVTEIAERVQIQSV